MQSERVLEAVRQEGPIHVTTLATLLDDHPITVDQRCHDLHQSGYLRRLSGGVFCITDEGREFLAAHSR